MIVILSSEAEDDLEAIADWIAEDSPRRAVSFSLELRQRCQELVRHPQRYPLISRDNRSVRRRAYKGYLILYRVSSERVEILHVLHGSRDYETLLFPDP